MTRPRNSSLEFKLVRHQKKGCKVQGSGFRPRSQGGLQVLLAVRRCGILHGVSPKGWWRSLSSYIRGEQPVEQRQMAVAVLKKLNSIPKVLRHAQARG